MTLKTLIANIGRLTLLCLSTTSLFAAEFPGGFVEQPKSATPRALMTPTEIRNMLPERGKFTFPAPYNTHGVRLTNASDCSGSDCVNYVGYSYWRRMNNHIGQETILILVGLDRSRGGAGPSLIAYNKITDEVINMGPLLDDSSNLNWATAESWYFSANEPYTVYMNSYTGLLRYDVVSRQTRTVFDVSQLLGSGYYLWQPHSSADDRTHSATVRDAGNYAMLGCIVYREDLGRHDYYPSRGDFDECQIDKSGEWLLIKEDVDGKDGEDNRIINVATGQERILLDRDGAAGHSDMGYGYMIAADNWASDANTQKLWDFRADTLEGIRVYHNADWDAEAPAHLSHSNAAPGTSPGQQFACGSSANRNNRVHANEIICFRLDGRDEALVVAPVMTDLNASGGGDDYAKSPKGNLDVSGQYFIWTGNMGGSRLDAFLVKVPTHLLTGGTTVPSVPDSTSDPDPTTNPKPTPDAEPTPDPTPTPDPVTNGPSTALDWTELVNAAVVGSTLTKTGGCDGCSDAGASSQQEIASGDGSFEFTVDDNQKLRYVGLSVNQQGTGAAQIDFALALQAGYVEVRENGAYRSDTPINTGDTLRISVQAGKVSYARNGTVFHTSTATPAYPLRAYATLFSQGGTVSNGQWAAGNINESDGGGSSSPSPEGEDTTGTAPASEVTWERLKKAVVNGNVLSKSAGCNGCADAGAISAQVIVQGNSGFLEFTVDETSKQRYVGLAAMQPGTGAKQIDFALSLQSGYAEVREKGAYRADIPISTGDILGVRVTNGTISYARNGQTFYTSSTAVSSNLHAWASLLSRGSTVSNAVIATGN